MCDMTKICSKILVHSVQEAREPTSMYVYVCGCVWGVCMGGVHQERLCSTCARTRKQRWHCPGGSADLRARKVHNIRNCDSDYMTDVTF